jgi:4-hydroxythreonine-4-phosphate dehydrogenase
MSKQSSVPLIAVTSGDPGGIGPEIIATLFSGYRPPRSCALVVGAPSLWKSNRNFGPGVEVVSLDSVPTLRRKRGGVYILDSGCRAAFRRGADSRGGGRHAGAALDAACDLVTRGLAAGIVTAPISKRALNMAGYRFTGHTELFARYLDAPDCQMMMAYRDLRVVPITRHIPLKRVSAALTPTRIVTALVVVDRALRRQFGIRRPRIAVSGLNPHAGEGGTIGTEEKRIIAPALRRARRRGIDVTGPEPGDALFQAAQSGTFDAFLAMYHDQGLIPFKMLAKRRGVNVTLGLPVVRTSVDHGVAYDIAGKGVASSASLRAAYRLAEKLVIGR